MTRLLTATAQRLAGAGAVAPHPAASVPRCLSCEPTFVTR